MSISIGNLFGGSSGISDLGSGISSIFAGIGAATQANLKAQGLDIQAQGDLAEAQNYDLAAGLAGQNAQFTEASTAIKEAQIERSTSMTIGGQKADVAAGGFAESGSSLDLLRDSASQGALTKAVAGQQGLIQQAGYQEQQQSYETMSAAAKSTAAGLQNLANETRSAGTISEIGDIIGGGIKMVAGLATGGLSTTITSLLGGATGATDGFSPEAPSNPANPTVINRYGTPGPNVADPTGGLGSIY